MKKFLLTLGLGLVSVYASAAPVSYDLRSEYFGAAGLQSLVDFNDSGITTNYSWTSAGNGRLVFGNGTITGNSLNYATTDNLNSFIFQLRSYGSIQVAFNQPVYSFSADIGNWMPLIPGGGDTPAYTGVEVKTDSSGTYTAVGTNGLVRYANLPQYGFFGIISDQPIYSVQFTDASYHAIAIDNLSYSTSLVTQSVPEPSQLALVMIGLMALPLMTRVRGVGRR